MFHGGIVFLNTIELSTSKVDQIIYFMLSWLCHDTTYGIGIYIGMDMEFHIPVGCSEDRSGNQIHLQLLEGYFTFLCPSKVMDLSIDGSR